jgi:siderophore synthetase component
VTLSDAVAHLSPHRWARANRLLIRKALAEFAHERLITPEPIDGTTDSQGGAGNPPNTPSAVTTG